MGKQKFNYTNSIYRLTLGNAFYDNIKTENVCVE